MAEVRIGCHISARNLQLGRCKVDSVGRFLGANALRSGRESVPAGREVGRRKSEGRANEELVEQSDLGCERRSSHWQLLISFKSLPPGRTGEVIGKQLLRSGTSVGANYRSSCRARSNADFISKITIVEEEADESQYGLELLGEARIVDEAGITLLRQEAYELTGIFAAAGKTAKRKK